MLERGDMITFHEPFLYLYYVHDAKRRLPHFDCDPARPTGYEAIKSMISSPAERGIVFVKDMCYHVADYIFDDLEFLRRITHTFLIRTPEKSIASYLRLDKDVTLEEIGIEAQHHHFEMVRKMTGETPVVIDADDLQRDPPATVRAYCRAIGVPFVPESLTWHEAVPDNWQHVAAWHAELSSSSGIGPVRALPHERLEPAVASKFEEFCAHHLPYYLSLRAYKLEP